MGEKIIGVYGLLNRNKNMWYIGSSINVESRLNNHISDIRKRQMVFSGIDKDDDFEHTILKRLVNSKLLESWENYYIGKYNSIENGYNKQLANRTPIIKINQFKSDFDTFDIMNEQEIIEYLKISKEIFKQIKSVLPTIKICDGIVRYNKVDVVNSLLRENYLNMEN